MAGYHISDAILELLTSWGIDSKEKQMKFLDVSQLTFHKFFIEKTDSIDSSKQTSFKVLKILIDYAQKQKEDNSINPLCLFERIYPKKVKKTVWVIHHMSGDSDNPDIKKKLQNRIGIYLLYDSAAQLVYAGKTQGGTNDLYKEICTRLRTKKLSLILTDRKRKQVPLGDVCQYLTAYEVSEPTMIDILEGVLTGFNPNETSNIKMESIYPAKGGKKKHKVKKRQR